MKKGECLDFYQTGIEWDGPHPWHPSGGNNGNGRGHGIAHFLDAIQQVQGMAPNRQIKDAKVSIALSTRPPSCGAIMLSSDPS